VPPGRAKRERGRWVEGLLSEDARGAESGSVKTDNEFGGMRNRIESNRGMRWTLPKRIENEVSKRSKIARGGTALRSKGTAHCKSNAVALKWKHDRVVH
jgi:hypothetical protein